MGFLFDHRDENRRDTLFSQLLVDPKTPLESQNFFFNLQNTFNNCNHPLLKRELRFLPFATSVFGSYGKAAENYIKILAKHASNTNDISSSIMEKFIKKSLSFTIHQSWANTVINNLLRHNHKFVDPSIRYEFSNEYINNQSIDSHNTSHHNPNHHFFNNDRNPNIDDAHLINGNRMETRFRNYRFTVNLLPVETLD